jgi:hypothetical protein
MSRCCTHAIFSQSRVSSLLIMQHEIICASGVCSNVLSLLFFYQCSFHMRQVLVATASYNFTLTTSGQCRSYIPVCVVYTTNIVILGKTSAEILADIHILYPLEYEKKNWLGCGGCHLSACMWWRARRYLLNGWTDFFSYSVFTDLSIVGRCTVNMAILALRSRSHIDGAQKIRWRFSRK